ncbi:unnamed protein product, partial [Didymodactylos carnosus]
KRLSPYEKLLYDLQHDTRWKEEEKAGKRIGFFRIKDDIGTGNFSHVKLGIHLLAKEKVAIKILDKIKLDERTQRLLLREITSMEVLHHPNIIRLYEVIETPSNIYIVMEYASGGEFFTKITTNGKFTEDDAKCYFSQIVAAVEHLHSHGIIHRDIKAENVFFARERLVKLGDFGFSTFSEKNQTLTTFCGSPPYAAPELFRDENYIGIYVDIWAMGILLYFMVTALMPFRAENVGKLKRSILEGNYMVPSHVSEPCKTLIRGLLQPEPTDRCSIEQIRTCSWLINEIFPEAYEPLPINLANVWATNTIPKDMSLMAQTAIIPSDLPPQSSFEYEAHSILEEMGISSNVFRATENNVLTNRDSVNGTYRIILHRLQRQSNQFEREDNNDRLLNEDLSSSYTNYTRRNSIQSHRNTARQDSVTARRASVTERRASVTERRASIIDDGTRRQSINSKQHSLVKQTKVCTIL